MGRVVSFGNPTEAFDFIGESEAAAVNEACAGELVNCSKLSLCPECQALAKAIENRLVRAFNAGRASMVVGVEEDGNE